jgi:predicted nucleotidyltransferase
MVAPKFVEILRVLARHEVEFIVVGGMAAVFHGAPVVTYDLDVLHARTPANVARLLGALQELQAYYRTDLVRRLSPNESHLVSPGHQLLMTQYGPLDVLGSIDEGAGYTDLLDQSEEIIVGEMRLRVLELERLIAVKERAGRAKDLAALPVLRSTLAERRRAR